MHRVKKNLTKKSVKSLSFQDQLAVLEALPQSESDPFVAQKSVNYTVLNEILSASPMLKDNWETLNKWQVLKLVEHCQQMSSCRDLSNKLRGCLLHIRTH